MESIVVEQGSGSASGSHVSDLPAKKFILMKTMAKHRVADVRLLEESVDATETEMIVLLEGMLKNREIEPIYQPHDSTAGVAFRLTMDGWFTYLAALASIYEFPE